MVTIPDDVADQIEQKRQLPESQLARALLSSKMIRPRARVVCRRDRRNRCTLASVYITPRGRYLVRPFAKALNKSLFNHPDDDPTALTAWVEWAYSLDGPDAAGDRTARQLRCKHGMWWTSIADVLRQLEDLDPDEDSLAANLTRPADKNISTSR